MGIKVNLEKEKGQKEREVRDAIERAAANARLVEQQRGGTDRGQDAMRRLMEQNAERDRRRGKI